VLPSSRHSDDALPSEGLDLLGQPLVLRVAVAQSTRVSPAPAPGGSVGGDGDAVVLPCRHSDDALASQSLDLLRQRQVLRVTVAQPAVVSKAPTPDGAAGGDGEGVRGSSRHTHGALAAQHRREAGRRVEPRHALAVTE